MKYKTLRRQLGLTIVEFTLISAGLMLTLFGAFEVGRYVFTYQMMNEMTRKVARLATVCTVDTKIVNLPKVKENYPPNFGNGNGRLIIEYLRNTGTVLGTNEDVEYLKKNLGNIYFVRAKIDSYQYQFIPLLNFIGNNGELTMPSFETVLPRESLGANSLKCD